MDGYSVLDGLNKMTVGMKKQKSVSSRKKRYWRPNSTELAEFCQSYLGDSRCGGGRGERRRSRGQKGFCSTISPILSRGSDSFDSDSEQAATCSWKEDNNNTFDPEFKVFNVSGSYFLIETEIFSLYPDTLLGSERLEEFYRPKRDEYFIEHNKYVFPAILRFYTHQEELVCPPCMPKDTFEDCMEFYGLLPYFQGLKSVVNGGPEVLDPKTWKDRLSCTLQFPYFSQTAKAYAIFDICVIVLSTMTLVLESIPELTRQPYFNVVAQIVEACVNVYFTIQALLLLLVYSPWKDYFKSVLHWIDIISILPFYLRLIAGSFFNQVGGFRVLRLIRLLRVMKLFRHSRGSQTMMTFLLASLPEIMLLLLMWSIGVLLFGPLIFFIEHAHGENDFKSAFSGMWFCVVTIGTVGYGDLSPATNLGKFVSALYTILNLTIMTIPISIIITKFSRSVRQAKK
ncbi:potassium voltage-gated channel subfamily A member 10-like isoform X2 [Bolinopsis microptera]|uniref:potassium voltage-gated channel subfamily A member 10-like isoform X2 n=1 Tax=Bolinopsis microptera TaxID=2820187 RepID=UPI00307A58BF